MDGSLTKTERQSFISDYPDVAAVTPDLAQSWAVNTEGIPAKVSVSAGVAAAAATKCAGIHATKELKSVLGFTIYKFKHEITFCWDGTKVTSATKQAYTMSNIDPTVSTWEVTDKWIRNVGTATAQARLQLRVTQCILQYGCYAYTYPTIEFAMKKNGSSSYTASV